jgi:hypothetical protein
MLQRLQRALVNPWGACATSTPNHLLCLCAAATTNITSLLSTARTKAVEASASVAESATTLVHAASARIQAQRVSHTGPGATKNGSETAEAGGLPPSSAPGTAAEGIEHHRTTMQAVTPLLEAAAGWVLFML